MPPKSSSPGSETQGAPGKGGAMATARFPEIEVYGASVQVVLAGFGPFKSLASRVLLAHGLGKKGADGFAEFVPDAWYPINANLAAMHAILNEGGEGVMYQAGLAILKYFPLPPSIVDMRTALQSLDVVYHMNHRIRGEVMFNPANGQMLEGIGHYAYHPVANREEVAIICENPYPCPLDKGLVTACARRFGKLVKVEHTPESCRLRGDKRCTYTVTWRA
jgi:hypothetical protein